MGKTTYQLVQDFSHQQYRRYVFGSPYVTMASWLRSTGRLVRILRWVKLRRMAETWRWRFTGNMVTWWQGSRVAMGCQVTQVVFAMNIEIDLPKIIPKFLNMDPGSKNSEEYVSNKAIFQFSTKPWWEKGVRFSICSAHHVPPGFNCWCPKLPAKKRRP